MTTLKQAAIAWIDSGIAYSKAVERAKPFLLYDNRPYLNTLDRLVDLTTALRSAYPDSEETRARAFQRYRKIRESRMKGLGVTS